MASDACTTCFHVPESQPLETIKRSARAATSKPVQRAVVNSVLVVCGAVSLLCLAAIASLLFFQNFVPDQFVTTPVYLQYGSHPYGVAALPVSQLKSKQDYEVSVTLTLPRSPANLERGNFMISLYLLGPSTTADALDASALKFAGRGAAGFAGHEVLFHSRRPTLIPYVDPFVSVASRVLLLLYHMLFPGSQTCTMVIPLAEHVAFARDAQIPASAYVEIEAGQDIQIYSTLLTMTAQFHGLRWFMFHYRLPTFITFTSLFWVCAFVSMGVAWVAYSLAPAGARNGDKHGDGKGLLGETDETGDDDDDDSGEGRHGLSEDGQSVSQEEGQAETATKKEEEEEEEAAERSLADIPMIGAEADDEDEEGDHARARPSGSGTSYGDRRSESLRRRASRSHVE
ncbi:Seipin [Escovopsis weberi]|uniref:Seipin n=1 Tax=Escovopsis weberi TaxID=150374 RepID=A0A0M9VS87_ESCWE|nr:Seipin [Escovopsis weberi]